MMITRSRCPLLFLFFLSGFSGLVLELVWARRLSLLTGNGVQASAAVVALTLAGLALGARWGGARADARRHPLIRYVLLETAISLWAFATPALFRLLPRLASLFRGSAGTADLGAGSLLAIALFLLPGTVLMGASTPFLVRHAARHWSLPGGAGMRRDAGMFLGPLYGWNTLGGAAGSAAAVFLLLPRLGIGRTTLTAGILDLLVAAAALLLFRRVPKEIHDDVAPGTAAKEPRPSYRPRVLLALAATGALGGASQMVWTRLMVLFFGSSTHALGTTLAFCLAGLALGSGLAGALLERSGSPLRLARGALLILGTTTCLSLPVWGKAPALIVLGRDLLGAGFSAALLLQGCLSLLLVLPAAVALGSLLPSLTSLLGGGGARAGKDSGDGASLDSWGSVVGALGAAFLLLPGLGAQDTLRLIGLSGIALLLALPREIPPRPLRLHSARGAALPGACVLFLLLVPSWDPRLMTSGPLLYGSSYSREGKGIAAIEKIMRRRGSLLFLEEGSEATVTVRDGIGGILSLQINGKTDASTGPDLPTQLLAGRLPALLHPAPGRALVIGLASGATAGALLAESAQTVDCVEISPAVIHAARLFSASNGRILDDPRFRLHLGDGRTYLMEFPGRYDLITSQPTNPWIAGVTNLFTLEFFRIARDRLAPGGVLAVWLQGYSFSPADFRGTVATFLQVFPDAQLWEESAAGGDYFLLGWNGGPPSLESLERRVSNAQDTGHDPLRQEWRDPALLLAHFVAGPRGLARYSRNARRVDDDNLCLEYSAPRALWDYRMPELIAGLEEIRESPLDYFPPEVPSRTEALKARLRELNSKRAARIRLALTLRQADAEVFSIPEAAAAVALVRQGLTDDALPFLEEARRRAPEAPSLPLLEGWIRLARGESVEAARSFHEARTLDPSSSEAANGEGIAAWRTGDLERAKSLFLAAGKISPDDPEPGNNAASVVLAEGNAEEALPLLQRVLARHPRYVPAIINLGVAHARLGLLEEARANYLDALRLDPGNPDATYNLQRAEERARNGGK
jgi:spermidine synthase